MRWLGPGIGELLAGCPSPAKQVGKRYALASANVSAANRCPAAQSVAGSQQKQGDAARPGPDAARRTRNAVPHVSSTVARSEAVRRGGRYVGRRVKRITPSSIRPVRNDHRSRR